jgi:glucokinase
MLIAGDVGGTKTLLGLFEPTVPRPTPLTVRSYRTGDYRNLATMVTAFASENELSSPITAACFGIAGRVAGDVARLTNLAWQVDTKVVADLLGLPRVSLLNDLQAMACSIPVLDESELFVLQQGRPDPEGDVALIAAGTGLGEAFLHRTGGRLVPVASEGGHADFAARTEREITLLRALIRRRGRAEVEQVLSGVGLVNIFSVTHSDPCQAGVDPSSADAPALVSAAGLERRCDRCAEALDLFVEAFGAEAGNLALRTLSTGGVFVGGGIAPKILPALAAGGFVRAFRDKAPFATMLEAMPVKVILNAEAGLLGAATHARANLVIG